MKRLNFFSMSIKISIFLILFFVSLNQFKCEALERNSVLKINKSIYLAISNSLMLSLNDSLLCDNNLKQIDIINETGNKYNNNGDNHNYESIKFDTSGIISVVNGDYKNIFIDQIDTNKYKITYKNSNGEINYVSLVEISDLKVQISAIDYFLLFIPNNKVTLEAQFNENLNFNYINHFEYVTMFYFYDYYKFSLTINSQIKKIFSFSIFNNKNQSSISYSDLKNYIYQTDEIRRTSLCFRSKDTTQNIVKETCYWNNLEFFNENLLNLKYENLKDSILIKSIFINLIDLFNSDKYLEINRSSLGQITQFEKKQYDGKGLLIDHFVHTSNYRTYKVSYQYW